MRSLCISDKNKLLLLQSPPSAEGVTFIQHLCVDTTVTDSSTMHD